MRRYYICKVVGSGTETDPYRPKVADYPVAWVGVLGNNPDGTPKKSWALVLVNTVNHDQLLADSQIKPLPDVALDSTWGALPTIVKNTVKAALGNEGIDTTWIKNNMTIRALLRFVGKLHEDTFSENNFDVQ